MLWFQRIMGIQKKGLLVVFSECMFLILFHLWGSCAFCIITHQVLSSFLLSISLICHLFTLNVFEVPMSISHLEWCDSPSYHVSLPLVSPFLQTILHTDWFNGQILSCHSLFWILQCLLITFRKKSRFLNSACKALHSLISYSLSDFICHHFFIHRWNPSHMELHVVSHHIMLYHTFLFLCLLPLQHTMYFPTLPCLLGEDLLLLQVYSFVTFTRLNYKLLLLDSSSILYTLWRPLFSLYCSYLFMSASATRLWAPWEQEMSHSFLYLKCLGNAWHIVDTQ